MTDYLYDTSAIYDFLEDDARTAQYFKESDNGFVSELIALEACFVVLKHKGEAAAEKILDYLHPMIKHPSKHTIMQAMKFRFKNKQRGFSYSDALGYEMALDLKIPFLTSDRGFKGLPNVILIK